MRYDQRAPDGERVSVWSIGPSQWNAYVNLFPWVALGALAVLWTQAPIHDANSALKFLTFASPLIIALVGITMVVIETIRSALAIIRIIIVFPLKWISRKLRMRILQWLFQTG